MTAPDRPGPDTGGADSGSRIAHSALLPVSLETTRAGDASRLEAAELSLLQYPATELGSGPAGVHLRLRTVGGVTSHPLTGPTSGGIRLADGTIRTEHAGLEARTRLQVAADGEAWAWRVDLHHRGEASLELDLLHTLDVALTEREAIRRNEQYVAQYLDLTPVDLPADAAHEPSLALTVRQNMPGPAAPWAALGASAPIAQWGTDALQLLDRRTGEGLDLARELPSERLQHEHTLAALRTEPLVLAPGQRWHGSFWGLVLADHPAASGPADAALIARMRDRIEGSLTAQAEAADVPAGTPPPLSGHASGAADVPAGTPLATSLLAAARPLAVRAASEQEAEAFTGSPLRLAERDGRDERLLSAFGDRGHLVTAAKEQVVLRPHGHIQQVHVRAAADPGVVASTAWMRGVFCSQLTLGHASTAALTTVRRSSLGLERTGGVRLLLRGADGEWSLLSTPSLWRTAEAESAWIYLTDQGAVRVRSTVQLGAGAEVEIEIDGTPAGTATTSLLLVVGSDSDQLALHVTADGCPVQIGDGTALLRDAEPAHDAEQVHDGVEPRGAEPPRESNEQGAAPLAAQGTGLRTARLDLVQAGRVRLLHEDALAAGAGPAPGAATTDPARDAMPSVPDAAPSATTPYTPRLPALRGGDEQVRAVGEMLAPLAQNASVHFRSPRGLEQYTGGAWGTRDVCQGPVGLLLATDEPAALRATLLTVFGAQQEDGTWPQWFEYLPGHAGPGLREAHGDVVYWPLRALGDYLAATGDRTILEETAPWVGQDSLGEPTGVLDHLARALEHIAAHRTEDLRLPAYGHGDWNDSLQPASPELAAHLCSTWTTELEITALTALADALETGPAEAADDPGAELAARCRAVAAGAGQALREHLLAGGELAGYALLTDGRVEHLIHPADTTTGVHHGSLQMIHALADELLEPDESRHHLDLLREHLAGPTGIHLFDRPLPYHGGEMHVFQRAEAATFWGREVGLMYMHAHLRWIEALTHLGEAELAWTELLKAIPVGLHDRVRGARRRQANTYFSSSDAVFPDRYVAAENPEALFEETTGFEGGWRVYSSGPGLLLRIIVEDVLGIRRRGDRLEIDPVLPMALDGVEAEIPYDGGLLTVHFRRGESGCGVREVRVDGAAVHAGSSSGAGSHRGAGACEPLNARYRAAGVAVPVARVPAGAVLEVRTG